MDRLSKRSRRVLFAFLLFGLVQVVRSFSKEPGDAVMALSAVPVAIVAFEMGWRTGLGAAAVAFGAVLVWAEQIPLSAFGYATRGATYVLTAIVVGVFADRLREAQLSAERSRQRAALLDEETRRTRDAALAERARLARELHDVIAHSVSVMTVQATAARRIMSIDPDRASAAVGAIETTGREALGEMRRMLGVLRPDSASSTSDTLVPQPGTADIEGLVGQMEAAGLTVNLSIEGEPGGVPPSVDLSAYRILQEALTNVLKHAGPATVEVLVRYGTTAIELQVLDHDRASPRSLGAVRTGHGLVGMQERAALLGGDVVAGPNDRGGFTVRARLPLKTLHR
jgi:signal transduction histidine kinase